jgi:hypothetical protein
MNLGSQYDPTPEGNAVVHKKCGGVAFRYAGYIQGAGVLDPAKVTLANGRRPKDGSLVVCANCQEPVARDAMEFVISH